jgi:hypothetical protein
MTLVMHLFSSSISSPLVTVTSLLTSDIDTIELMLNKMRGSTVDSTDVTWSKCTVKDEGSLPHGPTLSAASATVLSRLFTMGVSMKVKVSAAVRTISLTPPFVTEKSPAANPATGDEKDTVIRIVASDVPDTEMEDVTVCGAGEEHASLAVVSSPPTIHTALGSTDTAA